MQIDIWSDIACPFCYLGKHQLEKALEQFEHRDDVTIIYHSFELDPEAPTEVEMDVYDMLSKKYGMSREQAIASNDQIAAKGREVGIILNQAIMKLTNTFDGHRLIHYAQTVGRQDDMFDALYKAYFTNGINIGNHDELTKIANAAGFHTDEVEQVLADNTFANKVREDEDNARQLGITGVPFFVIDAQYAISGAQGAENFLAALEQAYELSQR